MGRRIIVFDGDCFPVGGKRFVIFSQGRTGSAQIVPRRFKGSVQFDRVFKGCPGIFQFSGTKTAPAQFIGIMGIVGIKPYCLGKGCFRALPVTPVPVDPAKGVLGKGQRGIFPRSFLCGFHSVFCRGLSSGGVPVLYKAVVPCVRNFRIGLGFKPGFAFGHFCQRFPEMFFRALKIIVVYGRPAFFDKGVDFFHPGLNCGGSFCQFFGLRFAPRGCGSFCGCGFGMCGTGAFFRAFAFRHGTPGDGFPRGKNSLYIGHGQLSAAGTEFLQKPGYIFQSKGAAV